MKHPKILGIVPMLGCSILSIHVYILWAETLAALKSESLSATISNH